jgi:hypothetical protein
MGNGAASAVKALDRGQAEKAGLLESRTAAESQVAIIVSTLGEKDSTTGQAMYLPLMVPAPTAAEFRGSKGFLAFCARALEALKSGVVKGVGLDGKTTVEKAIPAYAFKGLCKVYVGADAVPADATPETVCDRMYSVFLGRGLAVAIQGGFLKTVLDEAYRKPAEPGQRAVTGKARGTVVADVSAF